MIEKNVLKNNIVRLVNNELQDTESNISKVLDRIIKTAVDKLITADNENDINWDELDSLFGTYTKKGQVVIEDNDVYVEIDDDILEPGKEYTLKYNNYSNEALSNFDIIKTFTA